MVGRWAAILVFTGLGLQPSPAATTPVAAVAPGETERLRQLLALREAELEQAQARLRELDEEPWYSQAEELGIDKAVESSGMTPKQCHRLAAAIVRESRRNGLDPLLVVAVIRSESSFDNFAVSGVGAMGLMQVMPDTGRLVADQKGTPLRRKTNLFDAELNVELGTAYLAELVHQFQTVDAALVAYNAGPGLAKRILAHPKSRKKFMAGYPHKVLAEYRHLVQQHQRAVLRERQVEDELLASARGRLVDPNP